MDAEGVLAMARITRQMIKEIQIKRFKGLRNTPLLKVGKVNLLAGANGRGKSSLCQVLLTLAQTWNAEAMDALLPNGIWVKLGTYNDIHYVYDEDPTVIFHIVTDNSEYNNFNLVYSRSKSKDTLIELENATVNGKSILDNSGYSSNSNSSGDTKEPSISLSRLSDYPSLIALRQIHYVAANRIAVPYRETFDENASKLNPDGSNVLSVIWNHQDDGCLEKVEELTSGILDGAIIHIESSANELVFTLNSAKDDKLFRPANVGYGHGYVLSVITALTIAKENETLIVENPEAHLHPAAQAKLMNVIVGIANKKNLQVFVETHSDHVLNTALLAAKQGDLNKDELQLLFFSGRVNEESHYETLVRNLIVSESGHIMNPPKQFFEQYATDLEKLYL